MQSLKTSIKFYFIVDALLSKGTITILKLQHSQHISSKVWQDSKKIHVKRGRFSLADLVQGAVHKLRRQARGEGGLPNVYDTT